MMTELIWLGGLIAIAAAFGVRRYRDAKWNREYDEWRKRYPPED
jgi:hypothetical protein